MIRRQKHAPSLQSSTGSTGPSRRSVLLGGGALAGGLALAACGVGSSDGSSSGAGKKLTITLTPFAGADLAKMPTEFAADYMSRHKNVKIVFDDTASMDKMIATYQADPTKAATNIAWSNGGYTALGKSNKMFLSLDYAQMPNTANMHPTFVEKDHFGVNFGADQMGIVYNTKEFPKGVDTWAELWSPDERGKVTFLGLPWWAIGMAAKANGGSFEDMGPGFDVWVQNAKNIRALSTSNAQMLQLISTGEAPLTSHYFGTSNAWKAGGAPVDYSTPSEGGFFDPVGVNFVAGSSDDQLEVMYDMVNEMLSPKWNSRWIDTSIQISAVQGVELTKKLKALPAIAKGPDQPFVAVDWDLVGAKTAEWTDTWTKQVVSKI